MDEVKRITLKLIPADKRVNNISYQADQSQLQCQVMAAVLEKTPLLTQRTQKKKAAVKRPE